MPDLPENNAKSRGRLSADEASQLAGQVAQLASSGLPLADGLRAWAEEQLQGRRLAPVLYEMADQLDRGVALDDAIEAQGSRVPAHVRGLLLAGVRSGHLAEVLEEYVDLRRRQLQIRRRIGAAVAYPILLLALLSAVFLFMNTFVVGEFAKIFEDFDAELPVMTDLIIQTSGPGAWALACGTGLLIVIVFLFCTRAGETPGMPSLLYHVPLLGPLWRFSHLAQFSRLAAMLLKRSVPLPETLQLAAAGVADADLARGCRRVAGEIEAGRPLAESLMSRHPFPPSMVPLIEWGQHNNALPDAFLATAEMMEGRTENQGILLETVLLPVTFLFVAFAIGFFIIAMFLPLISLIQQLT